MKTEVIIVGAGPVGLLLGNLLGAHGIDAVIIDKNISPPTHSRAIGITPPSLDILNTLNLTDTYIRQGVKIEDVKVHGKKKDLGSLTFRSIPSPYKFILSLPQQKNEELLRQNLRTFPSIRLIPGCELINLESPKEDILIHTEAKSINQKNGEHKNIPLKISAKYLCACDGFRSKVRELTGVSIKRKKYPDTFLMGDYIDNTDYNNEAHLFFTPLGSVESFPLPGKLRRWIIQTPGIVENAPEGYLEEQIERRSHNKLSSKDKITETGFKVYRNIMNRFYKDRIIFLGDAAHTISPIGGQGMNTGFADGEFVAWVLNEMLSKGDDSSLLDRYEERRLCAARSAAKRAWLSMRIGTIRGGFLSALRNLMLSLTLSTPLTNDLARHYAMLTIPFRNLKA